MKPVLAIDPGKTGGLAIMDEDGIVTAERMPILGMTDIVDRLIEIKKDHKGITCILEKTGTYVKGNSGTSAATFARHCGNLEAALYAIGISFVQIAPSVWMRKLGTMPKLKKARKAKIKNEMACLYPGIKVTLNTADALGILTTMGGK